MTTLLITIHVLGAILTVGPVTVAASMFPAAAHAASLDPSANGGQAAMLHRICRAYSAIAIVVPAFGVAAAARLQVWGQAWLITAIALTAVAAAVLVGLVLPGQRRVLAELRPGAIDTDPPGKFRTAAPRDSASPLTSVPRQVTGRLAAATGVFNLLWVAVAVLMLAKPGSPAGA